MTETVLLIQRRVRLSPRVTMRPPFRSRSARGRLHLHCYRMVGPFDDAEYLVHVEDGGGRTPTSAFSANVRLPHSFICPLHGLGRREHLRFCALAG
jgi:hypothetical protein